MIAFDCQECDDTGYKIKKLGMVITGGICMECHEGRKQLPHDWFYLPLSESLPDFIFDRPENS